MYKHIYIPSSSSSPIYNRSSTTFNNFLILLIQSCENLGNFPQLFYGTAFTRQRDRNLHQTIGFTQKLEIQNIQYMEEGIKILKGIVSRDE